MDLNFPLEEVWEYLTVNEKLKLWFYELEIETLRKGGRILFDMGSGTYEFMEITKFVPQVELEFTWGQDSVHFELIKTNVGCQLVFTERINQVTDHTPRDLA